MNIDFATIAFYVLMTVYTCFAGPCDRRASHIKACVRRYINEGHDVTSAEEMKQVSLNKIL